MRKTKRAALAALTLTLAIALSSCATAAAVADAVGAEAVKAAAKTSAAAPSKEATASADSSKPAEPAPQSNASQNDNANNNQSSSNNSSNNTINNSPVFNNSNNTVVNISNAPQGTKVEQGENGEVNVQIPEMPQQGAAGKVVYLDISGDGDLGGLGAEMREKGCNCAIAEDKESADYVVAVKAELDRCSEPSKNLFFCWATAKVAVSHKSKPAVHIKVGEEKGDWKDKDMAAKNAFKKLEGSIAEKLSKTINQGGSK